MLLRAVVGAVMALQSLGTPSVASVAIPPTLVSALTAQYPAWEPAHPDGETREACHLDQDGGWNLVADLDGDGIEDRAVYLAIREERVVIAALRRPGRWQMIELDRHDGRMRHGYLVLIAAGSSYYDHERGTVGKYPHPTAVFNWCEQSAVAFLYQNGRFVRVFVSD